MIEEVSVNVAHYSHWLVPLVFLILMGCQDAAKADYGKCVTLNAKGETEAAWKACEEAVRMDPTTESGKAAAELLAKMKPVYERTKAEREASEAKAAEERAKAQEAAQAARIKDLKTRVRKKYSNEEPDALCTGKGLPPYRWEYAGGTFAENAEVASAEGCVAPFISDQTTYCCPAKPFTGIF